MIRDENGFLCFENDEINLDENSMFELNDKKYFFKIIGDEIYAYNELIAEELAKDFGIKCAHSDLAKINGKYGIISEIFTNKKEKTISIYRFLNLDSMVQSSISEIWISLEDKFDNPKLVKKLVDDIVDIFMFDVLIDNSDRHSLNVEFIIDENGKIEVAPLFDNEELLSPGSLPYSMGVELDSNPFFEPKYYSFKQFLKVSESSYKTKFENKLWIISEENIKKVINRVEKRISSSIPRDIKEYYLDGFKVNREEINKILSNFNNKRRK